jgi:hypothetical protein
MYSSLDLHVLYRSTGGDNRKDRPEFYSKMVCLKSFLHAVAPVRDRIRMTFVNDGPMPEDRLAVMREWGEVVELAGIGNSPSYRHALGIALASPSPFVYFAEDDYLYLPEALQEMLTAFEAIPEVDYLSLSDHSDRYIRSDDSRRGYSRLYLAGDRHWRTCESTCMTFGARSETLRRDAWVHRLFTTPRTPRDRKMWRMILGEKWFFLKLPKRRLASPIPSLATHMEAGGLSPVVDWSALAEWVEQTPLSH